MAILGGSMGPELNVTWQGSLDMKAFSPASYKESTISLKSAELGFR
jgi:hypothetical protein